MATCPFLSYHPITQTNSGSSASEGTSGFEITQWNYTYGALIQVSCIGAACQIWDTTNSRCGMLVSNTIMDSPTNETDTLITLLEGVMGKISELDASNSITKWLQEVIGTTTESGEAIPTHNAITGEACYECGNDSKVVNILKHQDSDHGNMGASIPVAATLIMEYQARQDLDGNTKIFGFDFKCITDIPPMLENIEGVPDWVEPAEATTWAEYLAWRQGGVDPTFVANPDIY